MSSDDKGAENKESIDIDYLSVTEAIEDVKKAGEPLDKAVAGLKVVGVSAFNVGLFSFRAGKKVAAGVVHVTNAAAKQAERELKNNKNLSREKRDKLENFVGKNKELQQKNKL